MRLTSRRSVPILLATALACLLPACGGGGGDDVPGTTTLTFQPSSDGVMQSDGAGANTGGLVVGDTLGNFTLRSGLRFGITPFLPTGATIVSAKLRIRQASTTGTPYALLGPLVVDRVDFGASLNGADFNPVVLASNIGTLSANANIGTLELDVTAAIAADVLEVRLTSDFLLRFSNMLAANGVADAALLEDSENFRGTGIVPELVVEYL